MFLNKGNTEGASISFVQESGHALAQDAHAKSAPSLPHSAPAPASAAASIAPAPSTATEQGPDASVARDSSASDHPVVAAASGAAEGAEGPGEASGRGCYLVAEEVSQGTLSTLWSETMPAAVPGQVTTRRCLSATALPFFCSILAFFFLGPMERTLRLFRSFSQSLSQGNRSPNLSSRTRAARASSCTACVARW